MREIRVSLTGSFHVPPAGQAGSAEGHLDIDLASAEDISSNDRVNIFEWLIRMAAEELRDAAVQRGSELAWEPFGKAVEAG